MIYYKDLLVKPTCGHAVVDTLSWTHWNPEKLKLPNKPAGKVTSTCTNGLRRLGILKVLRSLKLYLSRQKAKDIPAIAWRREAQKEQKLSDLPSKNDRERAYSPRDQLTLELFQKQYWGKCYIMCHRVVTSASSVL